MRNQKAFAIGIFVVFMLACVQSAVMGQTANGNLANVSGGGSSIKWEVVVPNSGGNLIISAPDGRAFYREFKSGVSPEITLSDRQLDGLPEGAYSYELRLKPVLSAAARKALEAGRGNDDDPEGERAGRKRVAVPALVQSGGFSILNGAIVVGGAVEGQRSAAKTTQRPQSPGVVSGNTVTRLRNHRLSLFSMPFDIIHADDVIIQGSLCVGLDCVSGEVFGFDTIRLKENNTRIQFDDTSTSAGFPTNNWQIRANSSASGGESFLGFVDQGATGNSETGTVVFQVNAGAPANAIKVSSTGKVGFRTGTPVLDLHITTSDTPAHRLEQTSAGGFTAQTWDIAGNEANFFVRDVTGGSRLPFRIRPGAPTSSIDINGTGNVGIGTSSPNTVNGLDLSAQKVLNISGSGTTRASVTSAGSAEFDVIDSSAGANLKWGNIHSGGGQMRFRALTDAGAVAFNFLAADMSNGRVGIGTTAPDQLLSVNGDASKVGGGSWQSFSDERLKNIKGGFNLGLKAVMQLQPIRYEYKRDNVLGLKSEGEHVGFGAQALQKIIPEAVTRNSAGYLMVNNDPILWTMLNAIKEQQKEIAELKSEVRKLRAASQRRRK